MRSIVQITTRSVSLLFLLAVAAILVLAGCKSSPEPVTGGDADQVIAYAEPMTDNLLKGFNANDYATFSKDFEDKLRSSIDKAMFDKTHASVTSKVGNYVSRKVNHVEKTGGYMAVIYDAKFQKANDVTVRVVFNGEGNHGIGGLLFTAPELK